MNMNGGNLKGKRPLIGWIEPSSCSRSRFLPQLQMQMSTWPSKAWAEISRRPTQPIRVLSRYRGGSLIFISLIPVCDLNRSS